MNTSEENRLAEDRRIIEQAVKKKLGKPVGQMAEVDRRRLKQLSLAGSKVVDLTALPKIAPHLTWLSLAYSDVRDITPLAALPALAWLDLEGTYVCDLSPLDRLEKLKVLGLVDSTAADPWTPAEAAEYEKRGVKVYV